MTGVLKYVHTRSIGAHKEPSSFLSGYFKLSQRYHSKDLKAHFGCVNAIEFSKDEIYMASGAVHSIRYCMCSILISNHV